MSVYPSDQRCPRCQYPVTPGATVCSNCSLPLTSAQPASGNPYGPPPSVDPYGSQPPTSYGGAPTINSAPTMQSPLYPQSSGTGGWSNGQQQPAYPPPPPGYTSTQMSTGYSSSAPAYPGTSPGYSGSQPQGGFGPPPTYPTSQPPGGFSPGFSGPPVAPDFQQPQKRGKGPMIAIIAIVLVIVLGGGGTAAYLLTRPNPTITIESQYKVGSTPAGATDTTLSITGQKFSGNSSVTILLDGQNAPDTQTFLSDNSGNLNATVKITKNWPLGTHKITARDASNYVTKAETPIQIVNPGEANTPGPNGSPSNSVSFTLAVTITSPGLGTVNETLIITGKGDTGGTVCQSRDDRQTSFSEPGTLTFNDGNQLDYTESSTNECSGTYVGGHLTYTETTVTDVWDFNGTQCHASPHKAQVLDGTFTDGKTISGTFTADKVSLPDCTYKNDPITVSADKGTFTAKLNQ